jgi:hypothetical protein
MTSTLASSTQAYSLTNNDTAVTTEISNNQNLTSLADSDSIQKIANQNSDGKLDASITPFSNETAKIVNGTLKTQGMDISIQYKQIGLLKILDGDTILSSEIDVTGKAAVDRFIESKPWTNGKIPVVINSDIPNKQRIYDALSYVQSTTPITFEPVSINANGQITNSNYLRFIQAPVDDDSCYTFAGMVSPNDGLFTQRVNINGQIINGFYGDLKYHGQPVVVASWCDKGPLVHELGHDLGLWHEMKRCDRDQYVDIDFNNIIRDAWSQYQTLCDPNQPTKSPDSFGKYDYCSIMHYKQYSGFAIDGSKPVYNIKQQITGCEVSDIGQLDVYSPTDKAAIKKVYSFVQK